MTERDAGSPRLLPPPPTREAGGPGWSISQQTPTLQTDVVRQQRDGLVRMQRRLLTTIRELQAENAALRAQLARYAGVPSAEQRAEEIAEEMAEAQRLERERGIIFQRMPEDVYPGKPYVTQLELIRGGITRYSRQNISRLTRGERSIPAIPIADRILLPPIGVRALLEREAVAAEDVSPRRRPGKGRPVR